MEIEIEPALGREPEHLVDERVDIVEETNMHAARGARDRAQHAARSRHEIGKPRAIGRAERVDRGERHGLQRDAPGPALAHLPEHVPFRFRRTFGQIDMRADRGHAVRIGAAQREIHAALDIARAPIARAIVFRSLDRAAERPVGITDARDGMALVDMGVHVDERGPDVAAGEVGRLRIGARRGDRRFECRDPFAVDQDVDERRAIVVARGAGHAHRQQALGDARAPQPITACVRQGEGIEKRHLVAPRP